MLIASPDDLARLTASAAAAARLLRTLANERRLLILCQLVAGERAAGSLDVGLSQSALSQHLARLRTEGLVATRRTGQQIVYRLADPAAAAVLATLAEIFCPPAKEPAHDDRAVADIA
ncbi:metalloregulator ArsR/SmtB family transcription factor [Sandarakinorhabdus sp.]|uniref:ArsR/SmtB family transcription factor n=1 Tax=Sandarakinorhabdus sp. TaxID=1916663 RepID=UPI00286E4E54|nr:metalloregulator ArsR/SmtB family transcription factor [Sandarakinorhabdus sp.]